ncbi:MAG: hypothetical protein Tsb0019_19390 [Roseibium sp.]
MHRTRLFIIAALAFFTVVLPQHAGAEARLALIVGNGAYSSVTPLDNPVNDAELMAKALRDVGFEVTLVTDTSQTELVLAISRFGARLRAAGEDATGLFYYAGHGVQSFGTNFLLPVDIELQNAADLSLVGVPAQAVLRQMFSARNRTNIVILDACRNNPFESIPDLSDNGLAEMKAPRGTFLAYSTAPGDIAVDGTGENSPFTKALAAQLSSPGLPIETLFKNVRVEVLRETGNLQTPWDTSSLTVDFQFTPAAAPSVADIQAKQIWDMVKLSNDPLQVVLFLRAHPDSAYSGEARQLLQSLLSEELKPEVATAAPEQPKPDPVSPQTNERDMIENARQSGTAEAYRAYLEAFPEGAFAELARLELQIILGEDQSTDPIADTPPVTATAPAAEPEASPDDQEPLGDIAFNSPLGMGDPEIATRSISELITGSPRFPPIEGLPEDVWKQKTCSSCHLWQQSNLCEQAQTYVGDDAPSAPGQHPYGATFKDALRAWASQGCP